MKTLLASILLIGCGAAEVEHAAPVLDAMIAPPERTVVVPLQVTEKPLVTASTAIETPKDVAKEAPAILAAVIEPEPVFTPDPQLEYKLALSKWQEQDRQYRGCYQMSCIARGGFNPALERRCQYKVAECSIYKPGPMPVDPSLPEPEVVPQSQ